MCPQDENENNCVSSPTPGKKKIVTSCVSKINFLFQLYFIINSLMCLRQARSLVITLFFLELGSCRQLGGGGEGRRSCQLPPCVCLWPISSSSQTPAAELEGVVLALVRLSGPSDSLLTRPGLWQEDLDSPLYCWGSGALCITDVFKICSRSEKRQGSAEFAYRVYLPLC